MTDAQELRLLTVIDVARKLGCDRSTVYRMIREEKFPAGKRLPGVPGVKWLSREVDQFIMEQWQHDQ